MALQDRDTSRKISTGNYFDDVVSNIREVIQYELKNDTEQKFTELHRRVEVYDHDVINVPTVPSVAVIYTGWGEEQTRTIGKENVTVKLTIHCDVRYYQEILARSTDYKKTQKALWELARILRRNSDLNGLSPIGLTITGGEIATRARFSGIYAGGVITLSVPIAIQTRKAIS